MRSIADPMKLLALTTLATMLAGCGSSPGGGGAVSTNYPDVTGNWQFVVPLTAAQGLPTDPVATVSGSLISSAGVVTGILHAEGLAIPPCVPPTQDIAATGTIDASGDLKLTAPLSGGVATIAVNVEPPTPPLVIGTLQIIGGACAQASTALSGFNVPNISGTFSGTLSLLLHSATAPTANVTVVFVQANSPNADGEYPLSGTISSTGACTGSQSFTGGLVSGDLATSYAPGVNTIDIFSGGIDPLTPLSIEPLAIQLPGCGLNIYGGTLTFQ